MSTTLAPPQASKSTQTKSWDSWIVSKFQTTVPAEVRKIYDLREGDALEWRFDTQTRQLTVFPKRAQLLTPEVNAETQAIRNARREGR